MGERGENAFLPGLLRSEIPAALDQAIGVTVRAVIFDQRLNIDLARRIARPVGQGPAGLVGAMAALPVYCASAPSSASGSMAE
ncbi:hypothetical protein V6L77_00095 [Pannonibacter sp. Pt2-lr]